MIKLLIIAIAISSLVSVTRGDNNNSIRRHRRKTRQETARWYNDGWHSSSWPTYSPSLSSSIETTTDDLQSHSQSSATTKTEWPTYSPSNPPQYPSYSPTSHYPTYSPSSITTHDNLISTSDSDTPSYSPTTHDDPPSRDPISDTPTYSPTANESSPSSTTSQKTQDPITETPSYSPTMDDDVPTAAAAEGGDVVTSKTPTIPTTTTTSNSNTDYPTEVIVGPAEINFVNLLSDMITDNEVRLILNYIIGTSRQFNTILYESDCITPLSNEDIGITSATPTVKSEEDGIYDKVTIVYTLDIMNAIEETVLNMCVVFQLMNSEGVDMIMQEKRQVSLEIDL